MSIDLFQAPERLLFGWGSVEKTGEEALRYGTKALLISGKTSSRASGALDAVCASLKSAGIAVTLFCEVESDPSVHTVTVGAALARDSGADVVIALGGGSPLDAAKAISVMATHSGNIVDYEKTTLIRKGIPVIAIPTTAGTGSEVTKFVVITDTDRKVKMLISSPFLIPRVALLDPQLTLSIPPAFTAGPGMDALTHAIEAYQSSLASPTTDVFALSAIRLIGGNLVKATLNGANVEARTAMLLGQMHAGLAFGNASVSLVHAMSRPLGAHFGIPHGQANAILLPWVMEYNRPACPEKFGQIAEALGCDVQDLSLKEASRLAVTAVREIYADTGLPLTLAELGVPVEALPQLAQDASQSGSVLFNPRKPTLSEIEQLYHSCLTGK
ncbi:MAG: iron-containing alcohol dehydrogenase [Negativicutes bacterium]